MNYGAAGIADILPPPDFQNVPTSPASFLSYNISLNFSSIFAMLPASRLLARLTKGTFRSLSDVSGNPTSTLSEQWSSNYATTQGTEMPVPTPIDHLPIFPGPWGFFTSWYMLGLFLMAVLLHRMQNVITPSRLPARRSRHAYRFGPTFATPVHRTIFWRRLYSSILPLDFARTSTRLALHLPSVYFLSKMLLTWFILILQTSEKFPTFCQDQQGPCWGISGQIGDLARWTSRQEMSDICWDTFCAVCAAFLVEGFIKALDGMGSGFPIGNVNPNTSPFNLVGYAFLLHVYSSPIAHAYKPSDGSPSRPDKHVIVTISIPLLQLTIFHILSISKRLSTHRLLPTALTSLLSLTHFHGTLFNNFFSTAALPAPSPSVTAAASTMTTARHLSPYLGRSSGVNYPLLNYIPNIFETLLICIILLTLFLNVIVQLLVRGRVERLFSGLGIGEGTTLHDDNEPESGFFESLPYGEDFGVLLLRVGIASLEATGLRGWSNEVAPINLSSRTQVHGRIGSGGGHDGQQSAYGVVRMGRVGVGAVQYGSASTPSISNPSSGSTGFSRPAQASNRRKLKAAPASNRGFNNEVRTVDLGNSEASRSAHGRWRKWFWELVAFLAAMWGVLKGLAMFLVDKAKVSIRMGKRRRATKTRLVDSNQERVEFQRNGTPAADSQGGLSEAEIQSRREQRVYQRFLNGEDISDDEDDDAEEEWMSSPDEDEESEGEEVEDEREAEAVSLFSDLLRHPGGGSMAASTSMAFPTPLANRGGGNGEMVLAHLVHGGSGGSPLTRRRWDALVGKEPISFGRLGSPNLFGDDEHDSGVSEIPTPRPTFGGYGEEHVQTTCVICTTEARDIICWPCRCLAMCDTCREALGSKSAPSKHRCPCCRQSVEGYSRIYIP